MIFKRVKDNLYIVQGTEEDGGYAIFAVHEDENEVVFHQMDDQFLRKRLQELGFQTVRIRLFGDNREARKRKMRLLAEGKNFAVFDIGAPTLYGDTKQILGFAKDVALSGPTKPIKSGLVRID